MSLLTMKQHSTEQPLDFLVRINNQTGFCELTKLAADPVQEIAKLVFLARLTDPDLQLKLLDHIQIKDSTLVTDLVSLASITSLQRTFALREEKSPQPIFNASDSCHQQNREKDTLSILDSTSSRVVPQQLRLCASCRNCGCKHSINNALRCTEPATIAVKWVTLELSVDQHTRIIQTMSTQMAIAFTWIQFLQLETVTSLFVR